MRVTNQFINTYGTQLAKQSCYNTEKIYKGLSYYYGQINNIINPYNA